jgi:large subunit ribosomal protein L32
MKGRTRRSHDHAIVPAVAKCPACDKPLRPHAMCPNCHVYRARDFNKAVGLIQLKAKAPETAEKAPEAKA